MTRKKDIDKNKNTIEDIQELTKKQRRIISDERILTSALLEFAENGYANASLVNIARNARVSVGLVAQNFGCKELLFESVCKRNYQMLNLPYKGKKGDDWRERIYDIITSYQKGAQNPSFINELKFMCVALCSKDVPNVFNDFFESSFEKSEIFPLLQAAQKKSEIVKGDIFMLYSMMYRNICIIILQCKKTGLAIPSKEWFIEPILKKSKKVKTNN